MVDSFLKFLAYEKRYSKHTISSYSNDLSQFFTFIHQFDEDLLVENVDYAIVRAWIVSLVEQGITPRSINRKISTLRTFFKFLMRNGIIERDPAFNIKILKTKKQLPRFVNENEMTALFEQAEFPDDFEGWRDRAILELLYGSGIRLSELITLKPSDINDFDLNLKVMGKRNKERLIPFTKNLKWVLDRYRSKKKEKFACNSDDQLIVSNNGDPCYPMLIYRIVKKYLDQFTTIDKRSPHALRHTFATHLLNKGADLNAVKELLGHSSLAATQVYTHNSLEKLKKSFEQAHPKA